MGQEELRRTLTELHEKLHAEAERAPQLDPEMDELLRELLRDLETLQQARKAHEVPAAKRLRERASDATLKLDTEHPQIAELLGRLAHTLSQMGI